MLYNRLLHCRQQSLHSEGPKLLRLPKARKAKGADEPVFASSDFAHRSKG